MITLDQSQATGKATECGFVRKLRNRCSSFGDFRTIGAKKIKVFAELYIDHRVGFIPGITDLCNEVSGSCIVRLRRGFCEPCPKRFVLILLIFILIYLQKWDKEHR